MANLNFVGFILASSSYARTLPFDHYYDDVIEDYLYNDVNKNYYIFDWIQPTYTTSYIPPAVYMIPGLFAIETFLSIGKNFFQQFHHR